jgi:hypothetical protein
MKMTKTPSRILIITLNLWNGNYGGIMQAYALQRVLSARGYDVVTDATRRTGRESVRGRLGYLKLVLKRRLLRVDTAQLVELDMKQTINKKPDDFVRTKLETVELFNKKLGRTCPKGFSAIITGSDQVWRSTYGSVTHYMLDFTGSINVKRISYAASFGRDDLSEYSPSLIRQTAKLAEKFDAISVREGSGLDLTKKHWGVEATQHVDPTLLMNQEDYTRLVKEDESNLDVSAGNMFAYVLDRSGGKGEIIDKVSNCLGLKSFEIMPSKVSSRKEFFSNPKRYQLPPVTQWLRSFMDAEFVVTDSFHGCAFSIIFNKPFIAVGNKDRGLARFTSLLKLFELEDRLIFNAEEVTDNLLKSKIDWDKVGKIKSKERERSLKYLTENLNKLKSKDPKQA